MGAVYRAYDKELGQEVALKHLHSLDPIDRLKLKVEFRALTDIVHPNLVNLFELFVDQNSCFFTMEYVKGASILRYARDHGSVREGAESGADRLRDAFRQLALALHALHAGGKLHRDVKPSNVIVTQEGRVVLLDFGLVRAVTRSADATPSAELTGTIEYMAPEQAWGETLTKASDWYAFGVTLYETLAGELPIIGKVVDIALKKRTYSPESLRARGHDVPDDLDKLTKQLLDPLPVARPTGEEVIERLGGELPSPDRGMFTMPDRHLPPLIGRQPELSSLRAILDEVRGGGQRIIHVTGVSGIGKSSIVRAFAREATSSESAIVLSSRCYPQETVAFNAIDGLVDELAQRVKKQPTDPLLGLIPDQLASLVRVFPALAKAIGLDGKSVDLERGAAVHRRHAFDALRELLKELARAGPVVLWLDDVQWGDGDSGAVLRRIMRSPHDFPMLVVLSYRSHDRSSSACLRSLPTSDSTDADLPRTTELSIGPLSTEDSARLANTLLGSSSIEESVLNELIRESAGSPFLLGELVRYRYTSPDEGLPRPVRLGDLVQLRTRALSVKARNLIDVLSVAGAPLDQGVALRAAGLNISDRAILVNLERLSVVRTADAHQRTLEVYHHRIRDDVLGQMDDSVRVRHHKSIALAWLAHVRANPLAAIDHFEAADDLASVRRFVVAAATHASHLLAFDRAASLYRRAIDVGATDFDVPELWRRLAYAHASAGRGNDAGEAFLKAADSLRESTSSDPDQPLHLLQKAAEQFIQSGHLQKGMDTLRAVLDGLEIPHPKTRSAALNKATALRMFSLVRGVKLPAPRKKPPDPLELRRFDALWAAALRLGLFDHTFSSYASIRCVFDALALGEPSRIARALAFEAMLSVLVPTGAFQRRTDHLMVLTKQLCRTPYDEAFAVAARGVIGLFRGDFPAVVRNMADATAKLKASVQGFQWEYIFWESWAVTALANMGLIRDLRERIRISIEEAAQRDDLFGPSHSGLGQATIAWLAEDRPDFAQERADDALRWALPGYTSDHYRYFVSSIMIRLYAAKPLAAWEIVETEWALIKKNYFLAIAVIRDELLQLRGRAALGVAAAQRAGLLPNRTKSGLSAEALERIALECAKGIEDHGIEHLRGWALLLRAGAANLQDRKDEAIRNLANAVDSFGKAELRLYGECARHCLGQLVGGDGGAKGMHEANEWMREQTIENPKSMLRLLAPGIADRPSFRCGDSNSATNPGRHSNPH
jgi:serine/threonine protein kinase/tetratricopeptide (TPR) repeat protein